MSTSRLDEAGRVASPRMIVPAAWVTAVVSRRRRAGARLALGTSLAYLATELLKRLVSRRRPRLVDRTPWRSFPSGHSATSTAYLTGLALMAPSAYRGLALGAACAGAAGVNVLRVRAREHWLTDVLAGDVVGLIGVAAADVALRARRDAGERPPTRAERA